MNPILRPIDPATGHVEAEPIAVSMSGAESRHREGAGPDVFDDLVSPTVDLAIWHRAVPDGVAAALVEWVRAGASRFMRVGAPRTLALDDLAPTLEPEARTWLRADIEALLEHFDGIADGRTVRLEVGPVRDSQCRKFHVDHMPLRLITTYVGPGTHWVPDPYVRRQAFARRYGRIADANRAIVPDRAAIRHARAGDVLVMKGVCHPDSNGVVHRSPPLRRKGQIRVVAVLSAVDHD